MGNIFSSVPDFKLYKLDGEPFSPTNQAFFEAVFDGNLNKVMDFVQNATTFFGITIRNDSDNGLEINTPNQFGFSALYYAISKKDWESDSSRIKMIVFLQKNGAKLYGKNECESYKIELFNSTIPYTVGEDDADANAKRKASLNDWKT